MASPLLPDSATLKSTKYTPAQLVADAAFETFIFSNNLVPFIAAVMAAYRSGATQLLYEFATKVVATEMKTYLQALGYTVTGPGPESSDKTINISWV